MVLARLVTTDSPAIVPLTHYLGKWFETFDVSVHLMVSISRLLQEK